MSTINKKYTYLVDKILKDGYEYEDPNRKGVFRRQISSCVLTYDLQDGFPVITAKKSFPEASLGELKAFLLGLTNLKDIEELGVNFWRKDAYNYYLKNGGSKDFGSWFNDLIEKDEDFHLGKIYSYQMRSWNGIDDQILKLIHTLKTNPLATKKTVTMWNPSDLDFSCLSPCHWAVEFLTEPLNKGEIGLKVKWHQHSTDTFLGLPMNIMYYAQMCYMIAHYVGMRPLGIIGDLSNVHLYDNSFAVSQDMIQSNRDHWWDYVNYTDNSEDIKHLPFDEYVRAYTCNLGKYEQGKYYKVDMLPYSK